MGSFIEGEQPKRKNFDSEFLQICLFLIRWYSMGISNYPVKRMLDTYMNKSMVFIHKQETFYWGDMFE